MSLKEAPAPHYQGKVVLRRKLTGPSRLLLGKCKSRYKRQNCSPNDKTPDSPHRRSKNSMLNYNYSVQEETAQEPSGSTPNPLSPCKESKQLESSSEPRYLSLKPYRDQESEQSKAPESSRPNAWKKFFCPRCLRFKPSLGDEDQSHDFTFYNQQTRDSFDMAVRPSIIYQVIEQKVEQQTRVAETECRQATKTEHSFLKGLFYLREKLASPKPNHNGSEPAFVVQEDSLCPCLNLRKQLRHQVRHRAKKPSPFFQERIGSAQDYIQEETIVLSNRHTDEAIHSVCQSVHDGGPHMETLEVSVDVTPVTSECESKTSTLDASRTETCGKPNAHLDEDDAECALLSEEKTVAAGMNGTDEPETSPDVRSCQKQEDEKEEVEEENHLAVNASENLFICESSVPTEVNQEDPAVEHECESTVDEDGQTTSHSSLANHSDIVLSCQYESGLSSEEVMDNVDAIMPCPDGFLSKNGLDIPQREEPEPRNQLSDLQPPEIILYQTARLLVQAAMEAALRQLEKDLVDSVAGCYEETGDY